MAGESLTWFDAPSPASDEDIAATESAIGNRFPDDYRDFAKSYSGGLPNETDFEFADAETETFHASVGEFFTLSPDDDRNLVRWMERTEFLPSGLVPFAGDGGGNYICFDFRSGSNSPSIVFWHSGRRGLDSEVSLVAKTFSDFVELLHEPDDDEDLAAR
ncbi:MAG: SMI1/KNR4 family protein [Pirellulales bacterium]|nr:SMI1/KNR4 family protein [Pirellulales bacterium]